MLKGGVIMDVTTVEEARIAEEAGAVAVMALERVPAGEHCFGNTSGAPPCFWSSAVFLEARLWELESASNGFFTSIVLCSASA